MQICQRKYYSLHKDNGQQAAAAATQDVLSSECEAIIKIACDNCWEYNGAIVSPIDKYYECYKVW